MTYHIRRKNFHLISATGANSKGMTAFKPWMFGNKVVSLNEQNAINNDEESVEMRGSEDVGKRKQDRK